MCLHDRSMYFSSTSALPPKLAGLATNAKEARPRFRQIEMSRVRKKRGLLEKGSFHKVLFLKMLDNFSGNSEGSRNPWVLKFHGSLGC